VKVIGHALQLMADFGTLPGLAGAMVAQLSDTGDLAVDVFHHVRLFLGGRRHLLAHLGNAFHGQ
jgi:hypothetical protein